MGKITVHSDQGYRTEINIRQHTIIADELIQDGGTDTGPTPMEMLLSTAGACVAVTTRAYANRKGWSLEKISVELEMERFRREDYPSYSGDAAYITEIREHITFGGNLTEEQQNHLLAVARRCPVHVTLENPVIFVHMPEQSAVEKT